jgi:hypothetical protein
MGRYISMSCRLSSVLLGILPFAWSEQAGGQGLIEASGRRSSNWRKRIH